MSSAPRRRLPELTNAGLKATANVIAHNEFNEPIEGAIAVFRFPFNSANEVSNQSRHLV